MLIKTILLLFFLMIPYLNLASMGFFGVGGHFSINNPSIDIENLPYKWDPGYGLGFGAFTNLGEIIPNLTLTPEINYWQAKDTSKIPPLDYYFKVSDIQINCTFHYFFSGITTSFFAGGGLGYNFLKFKGTVTNSLGHELYNLDTSEEQIGLYVDFGYQFPISDFSAFVLARYAFIHHVNNLSFQFGILYKIK